MVRRGGVGARQGQEQVQTEGPPCASFGWPERASAPPDPKHIVQGDSIEASEQRSRPRAENRYSSLTLTRSGTGGWPPRRWS